MAAIPDYQKLYDDYSASFTGQAATDFNTWRFDIGVAEGDIKQWDVNEIFQQPKPNPINSIDQEIQNAQNDSANFSKD